ncbi:hypothetical protein T492DRAFT_1095686 [Pavlovales sp. CCMP2436]|nr:hypothetical protein T492DRAFT_1095686 [Pavlovales sp. CCMP2436]|mmetsp:Transcript_11290/g.28552  ORF Transcript_11290/g.28552 Transcript_11290/m.28552 type:complete len:196 (+) Transcript_11290:167-754(+)|eukprot:CAMPEP_0179860188 /NCGR_PEP_ID=MMETSP0982-20121206/13478_1 /TAXON_ID=483367 /ORGANISM="non described non described, Strain CCMP 2436" /LENGTH=195 /DNA_ID=CAMNT_0021747413 /DNA_START=147 /DNA_END=734 /DNA_ORIENTATION=+
MMASRNDDGRLGVARNRLRARLAQRGVTTTVLMEQEEETPDMGKTLMQQVLEARTDEIEAKMAALRLQREQWKMQNRDFQQAKGNSKANAAQFSYKEDAADNARARANVHHQGSHYVMAGSKQFQKGRVQGMVSRHSAQGDKMQAARMQQREGKRNAAAARDVANGQTNSASKQNSAPQKKGGKSTNKAKMSMAS